MSTLVYLGVITSEMASPAMSAACFAEALTLAVKQNTLLTVERALAGIAVLVTRQGDQNRSAQLFGMAEAVRVALSASFKLPEQAVFDRARTTARMSLGEENYRVHVATGCGLDPTSAIAEGIEAARLLEAQTTGRADTAKFGLTPREAEVVRLVAEGLTDVQIAERLHLSPKTVSSPSATYLANSRSPPAPALLKLRSTMVLHRACLQ